MTEPENTAEDTQLDSGSATEEPTVDTEGAPWEEAAGAEYAERLSEFDKIESEPVASVSIESPPSESDLQVNMPEDQSS